MVELVCWGGWLWLIVWQLGASMHHTARSCHHHHLLHHHIQNLARSEKRSYRTRVESRRAMAWQSFSSQEDVRCSAHLSLTVGGATGGTLPTTPPSILLCFWNHLRYLEHNTLHFPYFPTAPAPVTQVFPISCAPPNTHHHPPHHPSSHTTPAFTPFLPPIDPIHGSRNTIHTSWS
ncbi:hypothetical protein E2C01_011809 [Portunus trituberculatus]|uniref:Secreted protein n=1 Tax=Portunus trituberculatus TaxID=210409 RepID=A0A5B7DBZ3_PORTR|nr:hypothetical protein [Portunus trituberculatus]